MLSVGGFSAAAETVGVEVMRTAILGSLAQYRALDGNYRLENEWHYLLAST